MTANPCPNCGGPMHTQTANLPAYAVTFDRCRDCGLDLFTRRLYDGAVTLSLTLQPREVSNA